MSWAKVDDGYPNNPKVAPLTDKAFRLHTTAICFCARNLTDGALTARAVQVVMAETTRSTRKHVEELHHAGLWDRAGDGYLIHDYLEYNPSKADVLVERGKARDRMKRLRSGVSSPERSGEHNGERSGARSGVRSGTPSRPVEVNTLADDIEMMRRKAEAKAQ